MLSETARDQPALHRTRTAMPGSPSNTAEDGAGAERHAVSDTGSAGRYGERIRGRRRSGWNCLQSVTGQPKVGSMKYVSLTVSHHQSYLIYVDSCFPVPGLPPVCLSVKLHRVGAH